MPQPPELEHPVASFSDTVEQISAEHIANHSSISPNNCRFNA
jgi:hypothetical protein